MVKGLKNTLLICIYFLHIPLFSHSIPPCVFENYSVKEGLTISKINDIIQDSKGFIWLATYDGLVRFNGYDFVNFKISSSNAFISNSNRIDKIIEDKYGRLWLKSPNEHYCFNTSLEKFWHLSSIESYDPALHTNTKVEVTTSGKVWILSERFGCICIKDSLFNIEEYNINNKKIKSTTVNHVHEDKNKNTWLLTDNGITVINKDENTPSRHMFTNKSNNSNDEIPFFHSYETDDEIFFGSSQGRVWEYSKESNTFYKTQLATRSRVREIKAFDKSRMIILTMTDGFFIYNTETKESQHYSKINLPKLNSNKIDMVEPYLPHDLWFTTPELGIYKLNLHTGNLQHFVEHVDDKTIYNSTPNPIIRTDKNNNLWVQPRGDGFSYYNKETNKLESLHNTSSNPNVNFSNVINSAIFDKQDNLWFSTRSHGLEKAIFTRNRFKSFKVEHKSSSSFANDIRSIYQMKNGSSIITTKEGKIKLFDEKFKLLGCINESGKLVDDYLWPISIYSILQDSKGTIWLGSRGNGIYTLKPNKKNDSFLVQNYQTDKTNSYSISDNNIYSIIEDHKNHIWIATLGGGINLIENHLTTDLQFINSNNKLKKLSSENSNRVRYILQGPAGKIYAATSDGLLVWDSEYQLPESIQFHHYNRTVNGMGPANNEIMDIAYNKRGEIYLATYGGGISKLETNPLGEIVDFKTYSKEHGLPSDIVLSLQSDHTGNLWLATENDLVRFDMQSETFETFPEANNLLSGHIFSEATSFEFDNNKIYFGYVNGIISFSPGEIHKYDYRPNIVLSDFKIFNKPTLNQNNTPFKGNINDIEHIELEHNQNFFSVEFSALDFFNTNQVLYAYKLDGFDEEWNYTKKQRFANYTNIPKGKYTFKVKSTNGNGVWTDNERALSITITPSFWETPIAYIIYAVLSIIIFLLLQRNILFIYKLKNDIKVQKQISEMKLKFFTDVSHEIRTPLTMITAPIEYLINDNRTPGEVKKQLTFISQNTNRLLKLVNQILDFRKIQSHNLKVSEINLGRFTEKICIDFMEIAENKNMDFIFNDISGSITIWADQEALEKMIINLISNSFKYCHSGDRIKVMVQQTEKNAILKVIDNGPGISKLKHKDLFTRFSSFNEDSNKPSTGIGLSMVKEIADKHFANIYIDSDTGKGTEITLQFLLGNNHFDKDVEILSSIDNKVDEETENSITSDKLEESPKKLITNDKKTVLIVEDDDELRQFIKTILNNEYTVYEAADGIEGFEKATSLTPDFIVSDIMMPNKDGIELLKDLRNEITISHTPIILLTAKTNIESKIEGLSYGADDYITKPFSVAYFKARILNLIKQRERLHEIYRTNIDPSNNNEDNKPNLITTADEQLMEKVIDCVKSNLDNNDFSVEELAIQTGLSRSTFFKKIKSITGMSPVEYIRDIRLNKAAQLIKQEQLLVKEVCYMTGFSDLKYFGKCFKQKFGIPPVKYRNEFQQ